MHHYGEDGVEVSTSDTGFTIIVKNHRTGARITVTGPTEGLYQDQGRKITSDEVKMLGRELAHGFSKILT